MEHVCPILSCAVGPDQEHVLCTVEGLLCTPGFHCVRHNMLHTVVHESHMHLPDDSQLFREVTDLMLVDSFDVMAAHLADNCETLSWGEEWNSSDKMQTQPTSASNLIMATAAAGTPVTHAAPPVEGDVVYLKTVPAPDVQYVKTVSTAVLDKHALLC